LSLPGVSPGEAPPDKDFEILVSPGHVLAARLRDFVGGNYGWAKFGLFLLCAGSIFHYFQPPMIGRFDPYNSAAPNWPSPLHRVNVSFSRALFPALPATTPPAVHKINKAFLADGNDPATLPAGVTADAVSVLLSNGLQTWINAAGLGTDMTKAPGLNILPPTLTITRDADFLAKMTPANLAGGLLGIPTGPLGNTISAVNKMTGNPGTGPYFYGAIINHQVGLYVLTSGGDGLTCVTISGPATGPCIAASQAAVDADFGPAQSGAGYVTVGSNFLAALADSKDH
jgi:hypothetical protein